MSERDLVRRWSAAGQEALFAGWRERPAALRRRLVADLTELAPALVERLASELRAEERRGPPARLEPLAPIPLADWRGRREARQAGEELIASGRTALLTVAGGQATRLGWEGPKGCFPISPLRRASLFQIFAEKALAARRRYGARLEWLILTSPLNHERTLEFFAAHEFFGLPREEVTLFPQGLLPTLSPEGLLLLAEDGGLVRNPGGHGGVLDALRAAGLTGRLAAAGVEELFYFQVDNPLVRVPDPEFVGLHRLRGSEMSSKVIPKAGAEEKLGVPGLSEGRPGVIEYSDLDADNMHARTPTGSLRFAHGSIAIHLLNVPFLARLPLPLPLHLAKKPVRTLIPGPGPAGVRLEERPAVKFESFIFDAIPQAANPLFFETSRAEEFAPLKNSTGADSIQTCVDGLVRQAALWLERCGVEVPWEGGRPLHRVEVSPLFALDEEELKIRLGSSVNRIDEDILLA